MTKLTDPFPLDAHAWRVLRKSNDGKKATCAIYVDARDIQERLDTVVGAGNWGTDMVTTYFGQGNEPWVATCTLTINGVSKTDVGEGSTAKGAATDALKRAAVQWGVGRYLYSDTVLTGWFEVDSYGYFSKSSDDQIRKLLAQKLQKMGVTNGAGRAVSPNGHDTRQPPTPPQQAPVDEDFYNRNDPPPEDENWDAMWDGTGAVPVQEAAAGLAGYFDAVLQAQAKPPVVAFVDEMRTKDASSRKGDEFSPMSEKQYGYMSSLLDNGYGEESHGAILTVLLGRPINRDNIPGWKCKEIIDWIKEPDDHRPQLNALHVIAKAAVEAQEAEMGV